MQNICSIMDETSDSLAQHSTTQHIHSTQLGHVKCLGQPRATGQLHDNIKVDTVLCASDTLSSPMVRHTNANLVSLLLRASHVAAGPSKNPSEFCIAIQQLDGLLA
eukprot:COSAG01_NODE_318_length_18932_cov_26.063983_15_plen_106_part_00